MKEQRVQELPPLQLKPIISYPRIAEADEQYLLSIDVQLVDGSPWPYQEEEFEISFVLETTPFFTHEPLGEQEPGIVLHRFGSTYGAAEYLLTASHYPIAPGTIKIALLNGWGLPIAQLKLDCEVKQGTATKANKSKKREIKKVLKSSPLQLPPLTQKEKEQKRRDLIAKQLSLVGWDVVQNTNPLDQRDISAQVTIPDGIIAFQGYPSIENDYLLIIAHVVVGIVKIHAEDEKKINEINEKALQQLSKKMKINLNFANFSATLEPPFQHIPFVYHTTGSETTFINYLEPDHSSRKVYTFHQPETFIPYLGITTKNQYNLLRAHLRSMPPLEQGSLLDYQFEALQRIEQSLLSNHPRTLVQMESGIGKTSFSIYYIHRLLTHANAKRILYVVDNSKSKQQVFDVFQRFIDPDSTQKFTDMYQVRMIADEKLDPSVHVYIGTMYDLYRIYSSGREGEQLPAPLYQEETTETAQKNYCSDLPIEYFDAIFLSECEQLNFQVWQPVLDYFDTFIVGASIAAIPNDTISNFFNQNVIYVLFSEAKVNEERQEQIETSTQRQKQIASTMRTVRNLLRTDEGLSYESDRLSLLVWLLFLKNLDDFEQTQEVLLGDNYIPIIDKGYRWRDWVAGDSPTYQRRGEELLHFINYDMIPYLSRLRGEDRRDIRTIISTIFRDTSNRVRSGYILREVVDKLDSINFNSSGDVQAVSLFYETMLQEMRDSASTGGEFYTPYPVVRFIIDRLQPQLGERILDPTCGIAGFLVEAHKLLEGQLRTPEQRRQLQNDLMGIEKKPLAYLLAIMHMLLHGIEAPNIMEANALRMNVHHIQDEDRVEIIATTPPFGAREERAIAYDFPEEVRTTETPLLFMQYCMQMLKRPGGRCGIVLSNGFFSRRGAASNIRFDLLTRFNLHTIIRLPPGVFAPHTNIPTNILFFEAPQDITHPNYKHHTKEVWYYEIPAPQGHNGYTKTRPIQYEALQPCIDWWDNRVENEHAWKVSIEQIFANDCKLDYHNPHPNYGKS